MTHLHSVKIIHNSLSYFMLRKVSASHCTPELWLSSKWLQYLEGVLENSKSSQNSDFPTFPRTLGASRNALVKLGLWKEWREQTRWSSYQVLVHGSTAPVARDPAPEAQVQKGHFCSLVSTNQAKNIEMFFTHPLHPQYSFTSEISSWSPGLSHISWCAQCRFLLH